ncbi:MAG: Chromosomal replication initiator protein DnaA [Candidatus Uhrbacteria bacterium GW2011_GWD2_52_7]|uniref:Chromosomal replication initiator protein DnaA n=1 Tax=Candidatus Uhrbacteria bacterium GW2011_GWD2_52_7 TaxID=1618989 RepID=A0A0G2A992_9BACT|nr:MAG: Chromosomal replication initiator protein DnaA [Candidatus Uhrbacteria bacterium GW2011_GWD2_52_7]
MNTHELWQAVLGEMELKVSKAHFTTWFKNTFVSEYRNGEVIIAVPNTFAQSWLGKKHHRDILHTIQNITNQAVRSLSYRVETKNNGPQPLIIEEKKAQAPEPYSHEDYGFTPSASYSESASNGTITINPLYTFNTFVVGKQNELAHAAAHAVANQPGGTYNPLFIYGGVGLGKTHLLHAIANEIRRKSSNVRILYVTCERFTNDFINAIRSGKGKEFKDRYRNVDLLLIDDIQFITGKEGTQEEFFHTFNALHQENKQIVVCSDRPPRSIAGLEKRLQSRLEWGMLVDVGTPDLETRIAILQRKCIEKNFPLDRDILHYIASTIFSNVRELEGALNKIIAVHQFRGMQPSLEGIKPIVASFESENVRKTVTPRQLITVVSEYFDITIDDILGKSREKRLAFPRQIIMYLLREEMKSSYPSIGTELGGRDHTTAMHAYTKIAELLVADEKLQKDLELIKQKLYTT